MEMMMTRDGQNKRLTTTVWVDVTDLIDFVMETLEERRSRTDDLNDYDKSLDKALWFSIFSDGRCYLPLPHWKLMAGLTFKALGGRVLVRRDAPALYRELSRENRETRRGRYFRDVVQGRFSRGRRRG